ncbi:MAG: hypothetical protein QOE93_229 [Actinomycetota bacterium]|jgi:hypothetical protein|nr:hypothetical protein [Actinomycetota bacterium]
MNRMPPSRRRPAAVVAASVMACLLLLAACGSGAGTSGSGSDSGSDGTPTSPPAPGDLVALVASYDLAVGPPARIIVGLQSADQRIVVYGTVAFRFAYLGTKDAPVKDPVPGAPVTATYLAIPGTPDPPAGVSVPQLVSGSQARGVYAAPVTFDTAGFWQVEVAADVEGSTKTATAAFGVLDRHVVAAPGGPAPRSNNLTMDAPADVPRAAIDSRAGSDGTQPIPDPELHATTVAAALEAGRPVVVVVSTPVYCVSRFCGPVTDMVQELSHTYGDRAAFVHIEVFRDFQNTVINQAAADWIYPDRTGGLNEPWVFVVGGDGVVQARFDNVATRAELEPLIQALPPA